jgi:hypothetical protein
LAQPETANNAKKAATAASDRIFLSPLPSRFPTAS